MKIINLYSLIKGLETQKKTELTHIKTHNGWQPIKGVERLNRIVYLGHCNSDGDCFAVYKDGFISLAKGHLNSGEL